jgi:hypothetical protein
VDVEAKEADEATEEGKNPKGTSQMKSPHWKPRRD